MFHPLAILLPFLIVLISPTPSSANFLQKCRTSLSWSPIGSIKTSLDNERGEDPFQKTIEVPGLISTLELYLKGHREAFQERKALQLAQEKNEALKEDILTWRRINKKRVTAAWLNFKANPLIVGKTLLHMEMEYQNTINFIDHALIHSEITRKNIELGVLFKATLTSAIFLAAELNTSYKLLDSVKSRYEDEKWVSKIQALHSRLDQFLYLVDYHNFITYKESFERLKGLQGQIQTLARHHEFEILQRRRQEFRIDKNYKIDVPTQLMNSFIRLIADVERALNDKNTFYIERAHFYVQWMILFGNSEDPHLIALLKKELRFLGTFLEYDKQGHPSLAIDQGAYLKRRIENDLSVLVKNTSISQLKPAVRFKQLMFRREIIHSIFHKKSLNDILGREDMPDYLSPLQAEVMAFDSLLSEGFLPIFSFLAIAGKEKTTPFHQDPVQGSDSLGIPFETSMTESQKAEIHDLMLIEAKNLKMENLKAQEALLTYLLMRFLESKVKVMRGDWLLSQMRLLALENYERFQGFLMGQKNHSQLMKVFQDELPPHRHLLINPDLLRWEEFFYYFYPEWWHFRDLAFSHLLHQSHDSTTSTAVRNNLLLETQISPLKESNAFDELLIQCQTGELDLPGISAKERTKDWADDQQKAKGLGFRFD